MRTLTRTVGISSIWLALVAGSSLDAVATAADALPPLVDPRDGKSYPVVRIAGMTWFARNLDHATPGSHCNGDDPANCALYGRLYRWEDALSACPAGWHLSTEYEWQALERAIGLPEDEIEGRRNRGTLEGRHLKPDGDSGFDAQYGGWRRYEDGSFKEPGTALAIWTATEADPLHAWHRDVDDGDDMVWRSPVVKHYGLSVRCVRNRYDRDEYDGQDTHPAWSPDGRWLAYISNREGVVTGHEINFEIYVLDPETRLERRLTRNDAFESDIAWSPDGSRLAFKSYRDGNDEIYLVDADGSNPINLTRDPASDGAPAFTPDGSRIVFTSDRDGNRELYSMRVDGGDLRRLTDHPAADGSPDISPDGRRVAFVSNRDGNDEIYVMPVSGGEARRVTDAPLADWYPRWSPDGEWLALTYGDWEADEWSLMVMRPDGSERRELRQGTDSGNPSWRLDGTLAFGAEHDGRGRIQVTTPGGAHAEAITGRRMGTFEEPGPDGQ